MPRKINIPVSTGKDSSMNNTYNSSKFRDILSTLYPSKINFSICEVAKILNLSYDFVREKIASGSIAAAKFGDRYMVNVFELERILERGVK